MLLSRSILNHKHKMLTPNNETFLTVKNVLIFHVQELMSEMTLNNNAQRE